jgi:SAM-dependent methyltransferase
MHKNVRLFCELIKKHFPNYFTGVNVLDCGCLDINGNNRYLFESSNYIGIDIVHGRNVDFVTKVHEFDPGYFFDVVISTEMLEHDCNFHLSLKKMVQLTKPGGLLLLTAAGTGREEHGTHTKTPQDSPLTHDYYQNVTALMFASAFDLELECQFSWFEISYLGTDIRFAGIKR